MQPTDIDYLKRLLEAALFATGEALSPQQLARRLWPDQQMPVALIRQCLIQLQQDYQNRGVQLVEVAGGFRFQTDTALAAALAPLWQEKPPRYSRALLETLALIAYRQPVTRGEIEQVRGVSVSSQIMRTLQERGWIKVVGHREVPGRPALYATTSEFLAYFSLQSLDQLPNFESFIKQLDEADAGASAQVENTNQDE